MMKTANEQCKQRKRQICVCSSMLSTDSWYNIMYQLDSKKRAYIISLSWTKHTRIINILINYIKQRERYAATSTTLSTRNYVLISLNCSDFVASPPLSSLTDSPTHCHRTPGHTHCGYRINLISGGLRVWHWAKVRGSATT